MASMGRYENEPATHYLTRLRDMGFLFHGSDIPDIRELEPRSTLDINSAENTDTAIFATNNIAWATIFGVYGGYNGWSTDVVNGEVIEKRYPPRIGN